LDRLYMALRGLPSSNKVGAGDFVERFNAAMDDDFNTPVAMSVLFELAHHIQRLREKKKMDEAADCGNTLRRLGEFFSILQVDPDAYFQGEEGSVDAEKINALIAARNKARAEKDWQQADKIRDTLVDMGVVIDDTADGTVWRQE